MISKHNLKFLEDLKANNNRDWFLKNKKSYEEFKKDYHQLIHGFLEILKPQDANLEFLEVKNCAFRINRDIRFSKNKLPYKTHLGIWMNTTQGNKNGPGYYIHIEKGSSFIAGGIYSPEADDLKKIRKEIAFFYEDLYEILKDENFRKYFSGLDKNETNTLKNGPKDFDKEHPAIEFLKLKSFVAVQKIADTELLNENFIKITAGKLIVLKPLLEFLNRGLSID
ncbi:MAG: DUF2461 domain-containing protein [Flavobacteriaceae bacterium]|nr:DUF2461 domain-containing protein [Flavobacteriaceae bacterium]